MASILREITPAKEENKFECDATAQYNWIMGDTNFRFKCTFTQNIEHVFESKNQLETLDEGYDARILKKKFPFYDELPIKFDPTYKRDHHQNGIYVNKNE